MNWLIVITAVTGLIVSIGAFIVAVWRVFPWDIGIVVSKVRSGIALKAGETAGPLDLEEIVYHVLRVRLIMIGLLLAFCALTVICSTMIIVTANSPLPSAEKIGGVAVTKQSDGKDGSGAQGDKNKPVEVETKQSAGDNGTAIQADKKKPAEPLRKGESIDSVGNKEKPKVQNPAGG